MLNGTQAFRKNFNEPDETIDMEGHGTFEVISFDDGSSIVKGTFEPGWNWEEHEKPALGLSSRSCEAPHRGFCLSGKMKITMDSGEEFVFQAGDAIQIPPGHVGQVEGDEPCVAIFVTGPWDAPDADRVRSDIGKESHRPAAAQMS